MKRPLALVASLAALGCPSLAAAQAPPGGYYQQPPPGGGYQQPPPGYGQPAPGYGQPPPGYGRGGYGGGYNPPPPPPPKCCVASLRANPLELINKRASVELEWSPLSVFSLELDGDYVYGVRGSEQSGFKVQGFSVGGKLGYWFSSYTALRGWYGKAVIRYEQTKLSATDIDNTKSFSELGYGAMLGNQHNFGDDGGGFSLSFGFGVLVVPKAKNILFQTGPELGPLQTSRTCGGSVRGEAVCIERDSVQALGQLAIGYTW